jgi:hypothetical protein
MEKIENELPFEQPSTVRGFSRFDASGSLRAEQLAQLLALFELLSTWDKENSN